MTRGLPEIEDLRTWIEMRFDRSGGPGGQNVNKVNTRVTLLFDWQACDALSEAHKAAIRRRLRTRQSRDGRLRVVSQTSRTQSANRAAAEERLIELLREAIHVVTPRRPTRPTAAAGRRRLEAKRQRAQAKRLRSSGTDADSD